MDKKIFSIGIPVSISVDEKVFYAVGILVFSILSIQLLIALKK